MYGNGVLITWITCVTGDPSRILDQIGLRSLKYLHLPVNGQQVFWLQ